MDVNPLKKIGTREEVYKHIAIRTAGGLHKDDIIEKTVGSKTIYISKKLSIKMKAHILNYNNLTLKKNTQNTNIQTTPNMPNTNTQTTPNTNTPNTNTQTVPIQHKIKSNNNNTNNNNNKAKTQKILFNKTQNIVKNIYYPDLEGQNLIKLKNDLLIEEAEEDKGIKISNNLNCKKPTEFVIEDINDIENIDINML